MGASGSIKNLMETTLESIKSSIDANTIVGDPIKTDTTVVIPISKVTVGFGIGGGEYSKGYTEEDIATKLHSKRYPVHLAIQKGYKYSSDALLNNLEELADLDIKIKSGEIDKNLALELFAFTSLLNFLNSFMPVIKSES